MGELSNVLTRLSTGLRINSGKDDPAGLIASELMKSDVTATSKAISNAQRANSVISIADSALGQVSNLLNDIRALVNEAANEGAMTAEQIAANQLQVNAALDSIDRIAKTTNYQGQLLLDGSMDFATAGVNRQAVTDLQIFQANFGTQQRLDMSLAIAQNAQRAQLFYDNAGISNGTIMEVVGNLGNQVFNFAAGASVGEMAAAINQVSDSTGVRAVVGRDSTAGQIMLTSAGLDNDINLTALWTGAEAGNYTIKFSAGSDTETTYTITEPANGLPGIIDFKIQMQPNSPASVSKLDETFNGDHSYYIDVDGNPGFQAATDLHIETSNGKTITNVEFVPFPAASPIPAGGVAVVYDAATGKMQIQYDNTIGITQEALAKAINAIDGLTAVYPAANATTVVLGVGGPTTTVSGVYLAIDLRANNALDIQSAISGTKFNGTDIVYVLDPTISTDPNKITTPNGDIGLAYNDSPSVAAATITWDDTGTGITDIEYTMRIKAKSIGSQYNDVAINFEQDSTYPAGKVEAVYDAVNNVLHIRGQIDGTDAATYGQLKAAIEAASPFTVDVTETNTSTGTTASLSLSTQLLSGLTTGTNIITPGITPNPSGASSYIKTGQVYGDIGTDHQTLFVRLSDAAITANDLVTAFNTLSAGTAANTNPFAAIAANFIVSNSKDSTGTGTLLAAGGAAVSVFSSALTGGKTGLDTVVTAKELAAFINLDARLSQLFYADLARNQVGNGYITLFDEAAYYGNVIDDNALQFLGPKGSPDVLFVSDGPNSPLYVTFQDSQTGGCISDSRPIASLNATNPNAAFSVQAVQAGEQYNDMAIRLIRLDNNHSAAESYAQYKDGPSNAMAYCSINSANSESPTESGKFILYGVQGGEQLNNVDIVAKRDVNQSEAVKVEYDEASKRLVITVNSGTVTLSEAIAKINETGIFKAEYDYSFNNTDIGSTGPGLETFGSIFGSGDEQIIGNTGTTGGHNGVLEVYVGGDDTEITAQLVIDTINSNAITGKIFKASAIGNGTGIINFRRDNIHEVIGPDGLKRNEVNMLTAILGSSGDDPGLMVVHLATDANGTVITSARDLVAYFDTLTAEQLRGISVSIIRPPGVDNLDRVWTYDSCGNVIEEQLCDDPYGLGLLAPTLLIDDCGNITYFPIEFYSYGEDVKPGNAYGSVIAANGINGSLDIHAKVAGADYNGVGFQYLMLDDPLAEAYADYDPAGKMITVYIQGNETAAKIKSIIENSAATKDLFYATLPGDGSELITVNDDYLVLRNGTYDAGYRGGAIMQGAADADEHRLTFESLLEGSSQRVSVRALVGDFTVHDVAGITTDTDYGEDMIARLNGNSMVADGRTLSIDTSMLKLQITLAEVVQGGDQVQFSIVGGGATFQIGADVVTNQQIRLGIQSVSAATLGGASGRLYQLRSGENASLTADTKLADRIVQEAIMAVAVTRGRLGAIQRNTLDPTIAALQDSLEAISAAEAQISNADFAEESSKLTRAQILVQSGMQTLQIANQFPQYAAALLGG
jgi:flagellin-like hook-associated protein FlgL